MKGELDEKLAGKYNNMVRELEGKGHEKEEAQDTVDNGTEGKKGRLWEVVKVTARALAATEWEFVRFRKNLIPVDRSGKGQEAAKDVASVLQGRGQPEAPEVVRFREDVAQGSRRNAGKGQKVGKNVDSEVHGRIEEAAQPLKVRGDLGEADAPAAKGDFSMIVRQLPTEYILLSPSHKVTLTSCHVT